MFAGKGAEVVAEDDQGLVAGHRELAGHRLAAVGPDSVLHAMFGWVVGGEAG